MAPGTPLSTIAASTRDERSVTGVRRTAAQSAMVVFLFEMDTLLTLSGNRLVAIGVVGAAGLWLLDRWAGASGQASR